VKFKLLTYRLGETEPILEPVRLTLPSVERAREIAREISGQPTMKDALIEIVSQDGTIKERWHRKRRHFDA
jgi:hypothetical protein